MKKSELFTMLAAAENDLASLAGHRPDLTIGKRADPDFVIAVARSRASLFMELAAYARRVDEVAAMAEFARVRSMAGFTPVDPEDLPKS